MDKKVLAILVGAILIIVGNEYRLYCTFDDPEAAVENVYRELESFINLLKVK